MLCEKQQGSRHRFLKGKELEWEETGLEGNVTGVAKKTKTVLLGKMDR